MSGYIFIYRWLWDDEHQSPWIGPFVSRTAATEHVRECKKVYLDAGRTPPKVEYDSVAEPAHTKDWHRTRTHKRPPLPKGWAFRTQAGRAKGHETAKRRAAERRKFVLTAISRRCNGDWFTARQADEWLQDERAWYFHVYTDIPASQLPENSRAIINEFITDGLIERRVDPDKDSRYQYKLVD